MNTTTKQLPGSDFDRDSVHMTFAAKVIADLATRTDKTLRIPVDRLKPLPGFNVRVTNDDYRERVTEIAASMVANGYYDHKPLAAILLDNEPDHAFVYDGGTRLDALAVAIKDGAEIKDVPVVIAPKGTTVEDLTVALVTSNTGAPLKPVELAAVVKRLTSYGLEKAEIARRIAKTERYVDNLLVLAGAPAAVRTAVADERIAAAEAVKLVRADPKTAAQKVTDAVKAATGAGKRKATPKTMRQSGTGTPAPRMIRHRVEVSLATGDKLGDALKEAAKQVRSHVKHASDKTDALQEDGKLLITIELLAPAPAAKKTTGVKRTQTVTKPTATREGGDPKPAAKTTAATTGKALTGADAKTSSRKAAGAAKTPAKGSTAAKATSTTAKATTTAGAAPAGSDERLAGDPAGEAPAASAGQDFGGL